jgi:hypothetical protein
MNDDSLIDLVKNASLERNLASSQEGRVIALRSAFPGPGSARKCLTRHSRNTDPGLEHIPIFCRDGAIQQVGLGRFQIGP